MYYRKERKGQDQLIEPAGAAACAAKPAISSSARAIAKGLFEQTNINRLMNSCTVEEEIMLSHPDVDRQQARNICGAMMFSGDGLKKNRRSLRRRKEPGDAGKASGHPGQSVPA